MKTPILLAPKLWDLGEWHPKLTAAADMTYTWATKDPENKRLEHVCQLGQSLLDYIDDYGLTSLEHYFITWRGPTYHQAVATSVAGWHHDGASRPLSEQWLLVWCNRIPTEIAECRGGEPCAKRLPYFIKSEATMEPVVSLEPWHVIVFSNERYEHRASPVLVRGEDHNRYFCRITLGGEHKPPKLPKHWKKK